MTKEDYEPDMQLSDRYINFSAELLKISLTAISGIGALVIFEAKDGHNSYDLEPIKSLLFASICFFGLTIGACLFHRFYSSDFMSYHIAYLRTKKDKEKIGRRNCLKYSRYALILSEYLFGIAIFLFGLCIYKFL